MTAIHINITSLVNRLRKGLLPRGINRVQLAYISHFKHEAHAVIEIPIRQRIFHWALPQAISQDLFDVCLQPTVVNKHQLIKVVAKGILTSRTQATNNLLFNLAHNGFMTPNYGNFFNKKKTKLIFMVHDLIPITHAEYCRPVASQRHFQRICNVLQQAHGIVTNSEATLIELKQFSTKHNLPSPPMVAAPLASGLESSPSEIQQSSRPLAEPYFVLLGALEARKNHLFLLEIWKNLREQLGDNTPKLVIIGQRGYGYENAAAVLERCSSIQNFITHHHSCGDEQLFNYIQHAQALLFPSMIEGYGLPIAEALLLKTPVIASDLPVYQEFAGNIPEYISPIDGKAWLETIVDYAQNGQRRQQQLQRIQNYKAPTWEEHFQKVNGFMKELEY